MAKVTPAPELVAAAKAMKGKWKCSGNMTMPDGSSRASVSTMKAGVDLDKMWITMEMVEKKSKTNPNPMHMKMFRSYNAASKTWTSLMMDNMGYSGRETSTDVMGGKMTFTGTTEMDGKSMMMKDMEEPDAATKAIHVWGEFSMDKGKTWMKGYDISCKR